MYRTLIHFWRIHLAILLAAAVASAVLAGALLVGDSVRGSLRDLTLDRLGRIDQALIAEGFFRDDLGDELGAAGGGSWIARSAPAILLRGSAVAAESGARASRVDIVGVDERFVELFDGTQTLALERGEGQIFPSVVLSRTLADELGVGPGDELILSFGQWSEVPRASLIGETDPEDVVETQRVAVTDVVPDRGIGRFGLFPHQSNPLNAFIKLDRLQRAMDMTGQVNALMIEQTEEVDDPSALLDEATSLEDLGLIFSSDGERLTLESREFVLRPILDEAIREAAAEIEAPALPVQTYLANEMRSGERSTPYSSVSAFDPLPGSDWAALTLTGGGIAPAPADDEILLNDWTAADLEARVGDEIEVAYYVVGPREQLDVESATLRVAGVVSMSGLAAEATLTPEYPGIQGAGDMSDWDPPFPVDLGRIRPKDETYWDDHGATPKAFVSAATGIRLWSTRFGSTTSIRMGPAPGRTIEETQGLLRERLSGRLSAGSFGMRLMDVKASGLRAAVGATDFAGLFFAFSMFLIASSAMLIGLLFGLGVERRAGEVGLLLSVGYPVRRVRNRLLAEGSLIAAVGALIGLALAVGYAGAMMTALRTLWVEAVGSSQLYLHVVPGSLVLGWVISMAVIVLSIFLTVRRLQRVPPPRLLAGSLAGPRAAKRRRVTPILAWAGLAGALLLLGYAAATGTMDSPALAFGSGSLLLISGLAFFALWCRGSRRRGLALAAAARLAGMAARNSSWSPGRSILSVALVASACFVIVAVAANKHEFGAELESRMSGAGGYTLVAEAEVPLYQPLETADGRAELGLSDEQSEALAGLEIQALRYLPGDDASCLNLYQPEKPRLLGVPQSMIERGGFAFTSHLELPEDASGPWDLLDQTLEEGVIPAIADNNSAMWILKVGLGEELQMEDERGEPIRLRLVGLLNTSIFQSELLISERDFVERFPGRSGYAYFLIDAPGERGAEASLALESGLGQFGFDVTTSADKLNAFKAVEYTYMSTFQMLGGLGLLLGTVGLGIVLTRNLLERRGELATMRAFGFRRSTLAWLVVAENAFLLLLGVGIGTLSALTAVAPRLATIHVPWSSLFVTLAVVVLVGMLSSVLAVVGALRVPLLPALKADR